MDIDITKLTSLVDKYKTNQIYYKDTKNAYNEHSCRVEYIDQLLKLLGWDVDNSKGELPQYREVIAENYSNSSDRPDYSLTLKGVTKLFVEAKKPSVDITMELDPSIQTRKYGWNAKHKLAILTNFEYLMIYDTTHKPSKDDDVNTALFRKYHFTEYEAKFTEIAALISRDSIYSGQYDQFVNKEFSNQDRYQMEIDHTFLKQINDWRVQLGNNLYQNNSKFSNVKILNDVVQEFINQIIFLRICEDRNLPLYHKLKDTLKDTSSNTVKDEATLKNELDNIFRQADKRYNSGLFKSENIIFDLNNEVIMDMINKLYYPQSPYLFHIIEPSILGKIYEAFLAEHLEIVDGVVSLAKKTEYKFRSVVTTPTEVVKYMVKNTLDELCKGKSPNEIYDLRIADIACGSGVFLEEVFHYLVGHCVEWYSIHNPDHLIQLTNGRKKLPLEDKKQLITSCIYGIDIDAHAVEVTKFSLLLKLIEDETEPSVLDSKPILPDLEKNIFHGNSLITNKDLDDQDIEIEINDLFDLVPFDWNEINEGRLFDAIVGNPPYVSTEDMHNLLNPVEVNIYKNKYKSAYKQFDKYYLFTELATLKLKENGKLSYIMPNKFMKIASGQQLRNLIGDKVIQIDDFGDYQVFPDKTIYSAIITLQNAPSSHVRYASVNSITSLWLGNEQESVSIENSQLGSEPWKLTADIKFMQIMNQLNQHAVPLSKHASIYNGIQTSAERPEPIYWFSSDEVVGETETAFIINRFQKQYHIEKAILKPYYKPTKLQEKGQNTYSRLSTEKQIIFPYDEEGRLYDIMIMKRVFPGTYEYLLDRYDKLVPRSLNNGVGRDVPNATQDSWYQYGRTQALTAFIHTPKLIVRVLSKEPMYAYDEADMLIASGGTAGYCAISRLEGSPYQLEYIQAWLAHPFTEQILKVMGSDFENGYTARGTFVLSKLPFVELDFSHPVQKDIYDFVVKSARKVYDINSKLNGSLDKAQRNILTKEKDRIILEIQQKITLVYQQDF